jgi:hypothetical protein
MLLGLRQRLPLFQLAHHVLKKLRVRHQIIFEDLLDLLPLVRTERLRVRG